jgi:hypothetical protein
MQMPTFMEAAKLDKFIRGRQLLASEIYLKNRTEYWVN